MTRISHILTSSVALFTLAVLSPAQNANATHFAGGEIIYLGGSMAGPPTQYPTVQTEIVALSLTSVDPVGQVVPLPNSGQFVVDSFFDVFFDITISGQTFNVDSFFDITYRVSPGGTTGSWDTEMLSMDLVGQIPGGPPIIIRESPTLPSPGRIAVSDLPGGNFQVDSFFDVWTEISFDGGNTFEPASAPMHLVMDAGVPEPASIGLLGMGSLAFLKRGTQSRA